MNWLTKLANKKNYGGKRKTNDIKFVVIHYTANDGDSASGNASYFANNSNLNASAHIFVDDITAARSVPDDYVAWSVGGSRYPNTKGAKFYGTCTNSNSLSIELCDTRRDGVYNFTEATLQNAAEVVADWMIKYNISFDHLIRHYDVTGKICPAPMVNDEKQWEDFKLRVRGEIMIKELIAKYGEAVVKAALEKLIKTEVEKEVTPEWAKKEIADAKKKGITDGSRMGDYATRLEVALMTNRIK